MRTDSGYEIILNISKSRSFNSLPGKTRIFHDPILSTQLLEMFHRLNRFNFSETNSLLNISKFCSLDSLLKEFFCELMCSMKQLEDFHCSIAWIACWLKTWIFRNRNNLKYFIVFVSCLEIFFVNWLPS